ncbi:MAG: hypothetical protein V9F03_05690 [Microthrixaceae bacterium]
MWPTSTGSTALLAAAAVVPLWFSGYRVARSSSRRRIRFGLLACACVVVVGVAIAGVVVITQRKVLNTAASQTIAAAKGMTESSTAESAQSFAGAADRFDSAASTASAIWTYPARLVPVVAQNLHAVGRAAESGAAVTRTVSHIAGSVDYNRLQLDSGGIDLATLASFEGPVTRAEGGAQRSRPTDRRSRLAVDSRTATVQARPVRHRDCTGSFRCRDGGDRGEEAPGDPRWQR